MNKHFLVTISNDIEHLYGIRFICSFFKEISEHHLTLLHIYRQDSDGMSNAMTEMWAHPDDKVQGNLTVGAKRSIDKAIAILGKRKMSIDQVITKTVAERYGKVKDILVEGSKGLYDAIVLGRRASYTLQWVFERPADELAQSMIKDTHCTTPLWICPETEPSRKNVLLCIGGSEDAFRAADHVGHILSKQDQHSVTLFTVSNAIGADPGDVFQRAEHILRENKISSDRINRKSSWGLSIPGSILSEAQQGGYAAVAVGMHGQEGHGLLKDLNMVGGTTSKLINKLEKTALWCCP
jgi:nucleotide-binding universal stress UspA family protein